ncbi:hypothetical protein HW555_002178, partial [Spodoptera exigua]
ASKVVLTDARRESGPVATSRSTTRRARAPCQLPRCDATSTQVAAFVYPRVNTLRSHFRVEALDLLWSNKSMLEFCHRRQKTSPIHPEGPISLSTQTKLNRKEVQLKNIIMNLV